MSISKAVFYDSAENILHVMSFGSKTRRIIYPAVRGYIYNMLTMRDTSEKVKIVYKDFFEGKENEYYKYIFSLGFKHAEASPFGEWVDIRYPDSTPKAHGIVGFFKITHKEYFTFVPLAKDDKSIYREMLRFIECLPIISDLIYPLNTQEQDDIHMKVPSHIWQLMMHPDSLVIHYRNIKLGKQIRDTVLAVFREQGINLRRSIRADSGFDWEHVKTGEKKSHSELMADLMTHHIKEKEAEFVAMPPAKLATWLEEEVVTISKWDLAKLMIALSRYPTEY
jgi:hypothetical protein